MTSPLLPHQRRKPDGTSLPMSAVERFARAGERPRPGAQMMRRMEVATLNADYSVDQQTFVVPQTEVFERAVSGFARGTVLATPDGPVAIEDLLPGDLVNTTDGPQRVLWIGSAAIMPDQAQPGSMLDGLIRVTAEAFGRSRPVSDVVLGPGAALLHNPPQFRAASGEGHVLTPVQDFIDGVSVFKVTPPSAVKVFHLMLPRHAAVQAGGLEVESYHPGNGAVGRMGENAQRLYMSLFPFMMHPRDFGPLGFPRVELEMLEGLRFG
ncbi:Hint domain-containing protein [Marinovum sp.]|uniref:Hint domain-containing protein n=1 Tax=Marinovum sp. TaxID=2024839 RepID=UPI003A935939